MSHSLSRGLNDEILGNLCFRGTNRELILKCDILKSRGKTWKKLIKKFHYEVWLIEIEIEVFQKALLLVVCLPHLKAHCVEGCWTSALRRKRLVKSLQKICIEFDRSKFECRHKFSGWLMDRLRAPRVSITRAVTLWNPRRPGWSRSTDVRQPLTHRVFMAKANAFTRHIIWSNV